MTKKNRIANASNSSQGEDSWEKEELDEYYAPISAALLEDLSARSEQEILLVPIIQVLIMLTVALISAVFGGIGAGFYALLGAACYVLPNTLLATRVFFNVLHKKVSPTTLFVGEFLKLMAVIALLMLVIKLGGKDIVWPALLAGLFLSLKSYLFLLIYQHSKFAK